MTDDAIRELLRDCPAVGTVWRHRGGNLYRVTGAAIIEATLTPAVVYEGDGLQWVRPVAEFLDGRFTPVEKS